MIWNDAVGCRMKWKARRTTVRYWALGGVESPSFRPVAMSMNVRMTRESRNCDREQAGREGRM